MSQLVFNKHQVLIQIRNLQNNHFLSSEIGNRRNWSKRLETSPPERQINNTQVETHNTGNDTLTNFITVVQESLGEINPGNHLTEPSQSSNEIQVWTQAFDEKNNNRIEKMREEMGNKLKPFLQKLKPTKLHQL